MLWRIVVNTLETGILERIMERDICYCKKNCCLYCYEKEIATILALENDKWKIEHILPECFVDNPFVNLRIEENMIILFTNSKSIIYVYSIFDKKGETIDFEEYVYWDKSSEIIDVVANQKWLVVLLKGTNMVFARNNCSGRLFSKININDKVIKEGFDGQRIFIRAIKSIIDGDKLLSIIKGDKNDKIMIHNLESEVTEIIGIDEYDHLASLMKVKDYYILSAIRDKKFYFVKMDKQFKVIKQTNYHLHNYFLHPERIWLCEDQIIYFEDNEILIYSLVDDLISYNKTFGKIAVKDDPRKYYRILVDGIDNNYSVDYMWNKSVTGNLSEYYRRLAKEEKVLYECEPGQLNAFILGME